jgi:DNA-binding transcriptional MerR regulator
LLSIGNLQKGLEVANSTGKPRDAVEGGLEIEHFARQNGVTIEQVKRLIAQHGNDRATLTEAAKALRESGDQDLGGADQVTKQARQQATPMHLGKTTRPH